MNNMEQALYKAGAHIVFKQPQKKEEKHHPVNKMKVPVPIWRKRQAAKKSHQRMVAGIPRDPVDKIAAIVTSKTPKDCIHKP
jgi:hypothetical protein